MFFPLVHVARAHNSQPGQYRFCFNSLVDQIDPQVELYAELPVKRIRIGPTMAVVDVDQALIEKYATILNL